MGMMDNFEPTSPSGYAEGKRHLVIENIETKFTSSGQEVKNLTFVLYDDHEKHMYKKIWDDEYAPRKFTEIVKAVGLEPDDLFTACKNGNGDNWLTSKLIGRHGDFDCRKGRPNKDGKQYLEPMTPSEIDYIEWRKAHPKDGTGKQSSNEPPIDSYQGITLNQAKSNLSEPHEGIPPDFPDDIPF